MEKGSPCMEYTMDTTLYLKTFISSNFFSLAAISKNPIKPIIVTQIELNVIGIISCLIKEPESVQ